MSRRVLPICLTTPYMDDQSLRKRIDDQLDKLESTHHFARAVFYGQNGQIPYAGKEE